MVIWISVIAAVLAFALACTPAQSFTVTVVGGTGGGHMIVSTDAAEREGFCMPPFSPEAPWSCLWTQPAGTSA